MSNTVALVRALLLLAESTVVPRLLPKGGTCPALRRRCGISEFLQTHLQLVGMARTVPARNWALRNQYCRALAEIRCRIAARGAGVATDAEASELRRLGQLLDPPHPHAPNQ